MEIRGPIGRRNSYLARVGIYFQFEVADVAAIHDARASKLVIGTAVLHGCETRGTAPRHGTFLLREVFLSYTPAARQSRQTQNALNSRNQSIFRTMSLML